MMILEVITIVVAGWLAGAESGSWSCVHPVIAQLKPEGQITFQKGLLKTFGRVMPIGMPLNFISAILLTSFTDDKTATDFFLRLCATVLLAMMIVTTVAFNVPVNVQIGKWQEEYNERWKKKRKIWRFFQGYRAIILLISLVLLVVAHIV